jgi:hypothetical protein
VIQTSTSLKYEPSEPLLIIAKHLFLNRELYPAYITNPRLANEIHSIMFGCSKKIGHSLFFFFFFITLGLER